MRLVARVTFLPIALILASCGTSAPPLTPEQQRLLRFTNASSANNWPLVFQMIGQGANPNASNGHAIRHAAQAGNLDAVKRLVAAGADPKKRGWNGTTAAINAKMADHQAVSAYLAQQGAVVDFGNADDLAYFIKKNPDYRIDVTRPKPHRVAELHRKLRKEQWNSKLVQLKRASDKRWIAKLLAEPQNEKRYATLKRYEVNKTTRSQFVRDFNPIRPGAVGLFQVITATKLKGKNDRWLYSLGFDFINKAEAVAMKRQKIRRKQIFVSRGRPTRMTVFSPNTFVGPKLMYYATFTNGVLTKLNETDYYQRAHRISRTLVPLDAR